MNSNISASAGLTDPADGRRTQWEELLGARVSCDAFDPEETLSRTAIERVIEAAMRAPSAYNLQNWRFVVAFTPEIRVALRHAAYGQQKITDAAAVVVVVGLEPGSDALCEVLDRDEEVGRLSSEDRRKLAARIDRSYPDQAAARAEAVRGASLTAMTLLLAAEADGIAACPMIGFDPARVAALFALAPGEIPALLVALGRAADDRQVQKTRRPVSDVVSFA